MIENALFLWYLVAVKIGKCFKTTRSLYFKPMGFFCKSHRLIVTLGISFAFGSACTFREVFLTMAGSHLLLQGCCTNLIPAPAPKGNSDIHIRVFDTFITTYLLLNKVETASGRSNLARNIEKQYYQRIDNLPAGTNQSVLIDIRGQNVSQNNLNALYNDIMERTNNGIKVRFKTN